MLCAGCGKPIGAGSGRGRPARYHDAACRQRARRARLATDHHATLGALADLETAVSAVRHAVLAGHDPTEGYRHILAATAALADQLAPATRESGATTERAVTEPVTTPEDTPSLPPATARPPIPGPPDSAPTGDTPVAEACTGAVIKTVDLGTVIGPGWTVAQHAGDGEVSMWHVQRDGRTVGTVCRSYDLSSNARGWEARTADYERVPAVGSLAASRRHDRLWRTRDAAAVGIAAQIGRRTRRPPQR